MCVCMWSHAMLEIFNTKYLICWPMRKCVGFKKNLFVSDCGLVFLAHARRHLHAHMKAYHAQHQLMLKPVLYEDLID